MASSIPRLARRRTAGRTGCAVLAACAIAAPLGGCVGSHALDGGAPSKGAGAVVAIGVAPTVAALLPESGDSPEARGAAIAVRDLNREAGLRFVLRVPPSGANTAVSAATAFRDDDEVIGVIGPTGSRSVLDAMPVYGDLEHDGARGLVAITPTATSPVLSGRSAWLFRVCPDDRAASRAAAEFARDSLGVRRAAIVYRNDVYGKGWSRAFAAAFEARGGSVVLREPEAATLSEWAGPYTAYARALGADVLVLAGGPSDAISLVRAARAAGLDVPVIGSDALTDVQDPATRAEIGNVRSTALFDGRRVPSALGRHFVDAYIAAYGARPGQEAALAYDATLLLGKAARVVGPDRGAVRTYLEGIGRTRPAFVGATGPITFDERHDVVDKPVTLTFVRDQ